MQIPSFKKMLYLEDHLNLKNPFPPASSEAAYAFLDKELKFKRNY